MSVRFFIHSRNVETKRIFLVPRQIDTSRKSQKMHCFGKMFRFGDAPKNMPKTLNFKSLQVEMFDVFSSLYVSFCSSLSRHKIKETLSDTLSALVRFKLKSLNTKHDTRTVSIIKLCPNLVLILVF
jgi:hypothetical protein